MKKIGILLFSLISLISLSAFSSVKEIARIDEKGTSRSLVYGQENDDLVFTVRFGQTKKEIKRFTLDVLGNDILLKGTKSTYNFKIFKSLKKASAESYEWCWTAEGSDELPPGLTAMDKFPIGLIIAAPAAALCAVVPGMPFLAGVVLAPVDGIITLSNNAFSKDAIAARKIGQLMKQKNSRASTKVFNSIINQIKAL